MKRFHPGDLVVFKSGIIPSKRDGKVMVVLESYAYRRDQGVYYRVICDGELQIQHSSQLQKVKK